MEELCQPSLNGQGGPTAPIAIQATNFGLKNDMIQQVQNSCQFHGLPGASHGPNPPPAYQAPTYQAPGYQALVHQPSIPQLQVVTTAEFTNYMKVNGAILKDMQTNMTSLINSNLELKNMFGQFIKMNTASSLGSGNLPSNTITNPKEDLKGIITHSGNAYQGPTIPTTSSSSPQVVERETHVTKDMVPPTNNGSTKDVQPSVVHVKTLILNSEPVVAPFIEPVVAPVSASKSNKKPSIPYPSRLHDQKLRDKANDQKEKFYQIFQDLNFNISFANALILMPKFGPTIKTLLTNKDKMSELARTSLNEHFLAVLLKKINLMPLSVWNKLSLPELSPACMTLKLADRLISRPVGVAEGVFVKVGTFHFLADFVVVDFDADPRVPLILGRSFLKTERALIDVFEGELTLRVGKESITFNLEQTSRYSANYNDMTVNRIDVIDMAYEEYSLEVLSLSDVIKSGNPTPYYDPIIFTSSSTLTPFGDSDFLLKEVDAFLALEDDATSPEIDHSYFDPEGDVLLLESFLNDDPSLPPPNQGNYLPQVQKELKICEAKNDKSSIDEPPEVEVKDLPPHLEYAFLGGDDKLPVIIAKDFSVKEKATIIKVLKSHKRAIAWKLFIIKGINPEFCTHKILMEDDFEPAVQHQRRVNPKIYDVIKKEGGFTVVENEENELIPTRLVTGWRVCIDYRKLNEATRKDNFPLPFMDQLLERLAGNDYYCFLDGFLGYFQIPIDPIDQEKTTFMCPYGMFAYRRIPFGLCNASGTFQRCMMAIFHDMIKKTMEVFMDDFSIFENLFGTCLSHLEKMLKRCEDTTLCLNWEKSHFMIKEGIILGHKISKNGIEVDKAKVDVIAKLPHPATVKGIRSFLGPAGFYRRFIQDFLKIARPMTRLLEKDTSFFFSKESVEAFQTLKRKLAEAPILISPDWDLPFELMCDASDFAIGVVLGKHQEKHFRPIHYASKTIIKAESNYTTTEKEMLAVVYAFEKFRSYLIMDKSIVYTDHSALKYLFAKKDSKAILLRWVWNPRAIISDRGTHFCNDQFTKVMLKYGVTYRLATVYHPPTSGHVEVLNRGFNKNLRKTTGDHKKVQLNELNELRDQAYENSLVYKEKTKRIHDSKIKDRIFNVGDRVLLFNSRLKIFSGKLKTHWSGPFTITHVFPYGTVELSQTDRPNFKVNGHRLKHYFGEDIPKLVVSDLQTFPRNNEFGDWVKLSDPKQALRGRHPMLILVVVMNKNVLLCEGSLFYFLCYMVLYVQEFLDF
nr:reverse transcriptase domain-containing protein [Tanacetum cinerariifolium]